jgi:hypothetical protein
VPYIKVNNKRELLIIILRLVIKLSLKVIVYKKVISKA